MRFTLDELATALSGTLHGPGSTEVEGLSIDSRSLAPGQLFAAVAAERDGHDFVAAARAAGAPAVLVERLDRPAGDIAAGDAGMSGPSLVVPDVAIGAARPRPTRSIAGRRAGGGHHGLGRQDHLQGPPRCCARHHRSHRCVAAIVQQRAGRSDHAGQRTRRRRGGRGRDGRAGDGPHRPAVLDGVADGRHRHDRRCGPHRAHGRGRADRRGEGRAGRVASSGRLGRAQRRQPARGRHGVAGDVGGGDLRGGGRRARRGDHGRRRVARRVHARVAVGVGRRSPRGAG